VTGGYGPPPMTDEPSDAYPDMEVESRPDRKKAIIAVSIAVVVAVIVFGVIFPQLVDWNEVFDVLRGVDKVDFALILLLGALRWIPSGWIYSIVLPGLSVKNGTQAWVATTGVGSTVPGSDLVLRVAMYRSWGFALERTMSGMFLSGIVEMATKLTLATLAVLLWGLYRLDLNALAIAAIAAAVIGLAAAVVALILRSERNARKFGEFVQRSAVWLFRKLEREAPDGLVERVLAVRLEARDVLGHRWPRAFLAAFIAQLFVYLILLYSIRTVGLDSDVLSWVDVLIAYAITTIITAIPISPGGVGIAELALVGVFSLIAGNDIAGIATAGVIIYRISVWLLPIVVGWLAALRWQATSGARIFGGAAEQPSD